MSLPIVAGILYWFVDAAPRERAPAATRIRTAPEILATVDSSLGQREHLVLPGNRDELQRDLGQRLAKARPFDELNGNSVPPSDAVREFLESVARANPKLALELIDLSTSEALMRHKMAAIVAEVWGATDPHAAWQWVKTSAARWEFEEKQPLLASVLDGIARSQPHVIVGTISDSLEAARAANGRAASELTFCAVQALVRAGAGTLAHSALKEWSRDLPPEQLNPAAIALVAIDVTRRSPADAAAWLETLPSSDARAAGLEAVATTWAEAAPDAAMEWAARLSVTDGRTTAVQRVFAAWQEQDSPAAMEWLIKNEGDPTSDQLITDLVSKPAFRSEHPVAAVQLAELIRDDAARLPALQSAILAWGTRDLSAALSYIEKAPHFSDTQRTQIIASLRHHADFGFY